MFFVIMKTHSDFYVNVLETIYIKPLQPSILSTFDNYIFNIYSIMNLMFPILFNVHIFSLHDKSLMNEE